MRAPSTSDRNDASALRELEQLGHDLGMRRDVDLGERVAPRATSAARCRSQCGQPALDVEGDVRQPSRARSTASRGVDNAVTTAGRELVDVVDADDRVVRQATRAEMRRDNLLHRAVYLVVRDSTRRTLRPSPDRVQGRLPGLLGRDGRRRRRGRRGLRHRGAPRARRGDRRRRRRRARRRCFQSATRTRRRSSSGARFSPATTVRSCCKRRRSRGAPSSRSPKPNASCARSAAVPTASHVLRRYLARASATS